MKTQENLHDQIQRSGSQKRKLPLLLALAIIIAASSAQATIIVNAQQVGGNVVLSYSGSVDLNSLGAPNVVNGLTSGTTGLAITITPAPASVGITFEPIGAHYDSYIGVLSGTFPTFLTSVTTFADSVSGDYFYFDGDNLTNLLLGVPTGYHTGDNIFGSMTFNSETFASLGLTPGTYEFSWVSGTTDNLILNVPGNVPDTGSTLALLGLSLGGVLVGSRRWKPATA